MTESYPRSKVLQMCRDLGHDPDRVGRIVIEPDMIRVEYAHRITNESAEDTYQIRDGEE